MVKVPPLIRKCVAFVGSARPDKEVTLRDKDVLGSVRKLPTLESPVRAWSRDEKTLYGIVTRDAGSELRALDIATGTLRTVATYDTRLRIEEDIGGTLRLSLDPSGRSFVTTVLTDRSNVSRLKGLQNRAGAGCPKDCALVSRRNLHSASSVRLSAWNCRPSGTRRWAQPHIVRKFDWCVPPENGL
jgi:hypothetical protein